MLGNPELEGVKQVRKDMSIHFFSKLIQMWNKLNEEVVNAEGIGKFKSLQAIKMRFRDGAPQV